MGKRKEVIYFGERFKGKLLTDKECEKLETIIKLAHEDAEISDLKNCVYDLSDEEVNTIIEMKDGSVLKNYKEGELRPSQTTAVAFLYVSKLALLADSVGLGKTVVTTGLLNLLEMEAYQSGREFRFLYLTEKNLVDQTRHKLIARTGNYVQEVFGEKDKVKRFVRDNELELTASVIGPYSLLNSVDFQEYIRAWESEMGTCPFDILIMDEPAVLNNSATKTYKNALFFRKFFDRVVLLDATPLSKELLSKYNKLNFLDETFMPTKTNFSKQYEVFDYTGPYPMRCNKYKNQEEFRERIALRALGRTRKGMGATIKNCSANLVVSKLSMEQRALLKRTSVPYMVYDCPWYIDSSIEMNTLTTPKLASLVELLDGELKDESSIIIYSRYKESQRGIKAVLDELGFSAKIMNGDTEIEEKNKLIDGFKKGDFRVLITNVQKGLDFGDCNVCVFYSYDPNPSKMVQFEGRITRSFNIENKHVYILVSKGDELRTLRTAVADRAKAMDDFDGSDFSCVMTLLLDKENLKEDTSIKIDS